MAESTALNQQLTQANADLEALLALADIGAIFLDQSGCLRRATALAADLFHIRPDDIGRPFARLRHQLVYEAIQHDVAHVLDARSPVEREVRHVDGRWLLVRIMPSPAQAGPPDGLILMFANIAQPRLDDRQTQFQARLLDTVEQAVIATDAAGIVTYWNRAAERLYGWSSAEALGRDVGELTVPEIAQSQAQAIMARLQAGESWSGEYSVRRRDGSTFPAIVTDTPVRDSAGALIGIVGIATDISAQKQTEAALRQALAELRLGHAQLRALSQRLLEVQETERRALAAEMHDEIGQLLTGLTLLLLSIDPRSDSAAIGAHLAQARRTLGELTDRVRQLSLNLRPPMLDNLGLQPTLGWLVERFTAQTQVQVQFEHLQIDRRFPPMLELAVYRIIQEALTNVARHAGTSQATVRIWAEPAELKILVEDQGCGFDPAALDPYRFNGLSGMSERVRLLGGTLAITAAPGVGTQIFASIPLAPLKRAPDLRGAPRRQP